MDRQHAVRGAAGACRRPYETFVENAADRRDCTRAAIQGAVNRLDEPTVTQAHLDAYSWAVAPGTDTAYRLAMRP